MKIIKVTFAVLFIFLPLRVFAQESSIEQIMVPLSEPGEPGFLIIDHVKGSINVTGYEGKVVIINASYRQRKKDGGGKIDSNGLKRISSPAIQLSAEEEDNKVTVISNSHRHTIDLDIKVPSQFSLILRAYQNGKITVRNVSGEMEISNINGDIILNEISGSAVVYTVDGNILVQFKEITPDIPMAFTSIEGKIDVTFPPEMKALVKMKTDNGEIYSDFEMELEKRKERVDKSKKTGIYKVTLEEWTNGKINGGGPEILFKSFDGNIYIRKRK